MAVLSRFDTEATVFAQAVDQVQRDRSETRGLDALGTALALASPEAAAAMLCQIGIDEKILRAAVDTTREWLTTHPVVVEDAPG